MPQKKAKRGFPAGSDWWVPLELYAISDNDNGRCCAEGAHKPGHLANAMYNKCVGFIIVGNSLACLPHCEVEQPASQL